jgi:hypothetical protein
MLISSPKAFQECFKQDNGFLRLKKISSKITDDVYLTARGYPELTFWFSPAPSLPSGHSDIKLAFF